MSAPLVPPRAATSLGQQVVRVFTVLALLALALGALRLLSFLALPVVGAILVSFLTSPGVDFLERRGLPRWLAVLACFGVGLGALVGGGLTAWPALENWLSQAPAGDTALEEQLLRRSAAWEAALRHAYPHVDWHGLFERAWRALEVQRKEVMETLPTVVLTVLSNLGSLVLAPILGFFLLVHGQDLRRAVVAWVPNRYFETALVLAHRVERQVAAYLRGALMESTTVALLATALLALAGMPSAAVFGALYGLMNVIPLAGPVIGAGAGLLYSLLVPDGPSPGVLLLCYGAVYGVDAAFINPLVIGKNLNLHPLTIILGITVGGNLGGLVGMLLIIPAIAVAKAVITTVRESL